MSFSMRFESFFGSFQQHAAFLLRLLFLNCKIRFEFIDIEGGGGFSNHRFEVDLRGGSRNTRMIDVDVCSHGLVSSFLEFVSVGVSS